MTSPLNILIILRMPEDLRMPYYHGLGATFPDANVNIVDHVEKSGPYIEAADVILTFGSHMDDESLGKAANLKWIQMLSTGVDAIVNRPTLRPEVIVTNIPGIHAASVSEAGIMFILALSRDLPRAVHNKDKQFWDRWSAPILEGKTVGIVGMGLIAEGLAPRCKAMGMHVVGLSSSPRAVAGFDEIRPMGELMQAIATFDYLVVLTPYTKATHDLIGEAQLAAMKPKSYLINLARGKIVNEKALIAALDRGEIAGAAIDVAANEPMPPEDPLWNARNLIITPHIAAMYDEYADRALEIVTENLRRFIAGDSDSLLNRVRR